MPRPGPQNGRFSSEPLGGATTLTAPRTLDRNASVALAERLGDTVSRITGEAPEPRAVEEGASRPRIDNGEQSDAAPAVVPTRPRGLDGPREGRADDLKLIKGVGPVIEAKLHEAGFFHFDQIAAWEPADVAWFEQNLEEFRGRVEREGWVEQARELAEEGETPHAHDKITRD